MNVVIGALAIVVVFGLVIFVHELGHFLAAKSVGVYAPRFSIGFGPALWRRRRGETEYIVAAFPLGGYVRMASRLDEAAAALEGGSESAAQRAADDPNYDPNAMMPFGPKQVPEDRWFESKPLWARLYILVAGVVMNFLLGLVICIGLAVSFGKVVVPTLAVGAVRPVNGQQLLGSIQPGDSIRAVNGMPVGSWTAAMEAVVTSTDSVTITTNRTSVTIPVNGPGQPTPTDVALAIDYRLPAVLGPLMPGDPAAQSGLAEGDSVVAIDDRRVDAWHDMVRVIAGSAGRPLTFTVIRDTQQLALTVTPRPGPGMDPETGEQAEVGKIGAVQSDVTAREPVGPGEAVAVGTRTAWVMGTTIIRTVGDLITRDVPLNQLGGPIAIAQASVQAARSGLEDFFWLIALLSINIGVLNLLPIPIFDGGGIIINVIESARGRPLSLRTREYILRGGLLVILLLFVLVMFNDTRRIFFG